MTRPTTAESIVREVLTNHAKAGGFDKIAAQVLTNGIRVVTAAEACKILKCSMSTFRRMGIPPIVLTDRTFRYRVSDIEAHLEKKKS